MDKVIISGKQVGNRVEEIELSPVIEQSEILKVVFEANGEIELIIPIKKKRELLQQRQRMIQETFKGLEQLEELAEAYEKKKLTPCELKRKLKYAKNPMEIKKLNKQLAEAYKVYGKKKRKQVMQNEID